MVYLCDNRYPRMQNYTKHETLSRCTRRPYALSEHRLRGSSCHSLQLLSPCTDWANGEHCTCLANRKSSPVSLGVSPE
jgi:hypothetical protein